MATHKSSAILALLRADARYLDCEPCYYCGRPGDSRDHVPPRTMRDRLSDLGLRDRYEFIDVACCHECNCLLGSKPLLTLTVRRRFIAARLAKRYAGVLTMPEWTDREISLLGPNLRRYVIDGLALREYTRRRIAYAHRRRCEAKP